MVLVRVTGAQVIDRLSDAAAATLATLRRSQAPGCRRWRPSIERVAGDGVEHPDPGAAVAAPAYPPPVHVLRDLGLDVEVRHGGVTRGRLAARGGGQLPLGVVSTAVDVLAGAVCARAISPDWMATSVLSLHLGDVDPDVELVLDAMVLRAGRSTVTVEVELRQQLTVGTAVLTFSRLPRRESTLVLPDTGGRPGDRYGFGGLSEGSGRMGAGVGGFDTAIGCRVVPGDPGRTETEILPYVRNSFGAVNGGVVAAVADAAARSVVGDAGRWRTVDLTVSFLGQGRVGPMVTSSRLLRTGGSSRSVRVEVRDDGQIDDTGRARLMVVAQVGLVPFDAAGSARV